MLYVKRFHAILLITAMLFTLVPVGFAPIVRVAQAQMPIPKVGQYVQFGSYNGAPILWRIIFMSNNGTGSPILLSENILTLKSFDASGTFHEGNPDRVTGGSNYYPISDLRTWLNSSEETVSYMQNPPNVDNVQTGINPYHEEKGFLADGNFTAAERAIIKPLTHKAAIPTTDQEFNKDGGSTGLTYNENIGQALQNYDTTAYFKNVTDSVFLLSVKQLRDFVGARNWPIQAKPTPQAVANDGFNDNSFSTANSWNYWLNTPKADTPDKVVTVDTDNTFTLSTPYDGRVGVRPAIQLDHTMIRSGTGTGTPQNPFILEPWAAPSDINLSTTNLESGKPAGSRVASISAVDQNPGDKFNYELVGGAGSEDNQLFSISKGNLVTKQSIVLEERSTFNIRIRAVDSRFLSFEKSFVITLHPPNVLTDYKVGDYVKFGTYYNAPILWRVVNLDPIGNPMLLSEHVLMTKSFDAKGDAHSNVNRKTYGSNNWQGSNLRQWLNSDESSINWTQNPPNESNTMPYMNYESEKGFLANGNFTETERSLILPTRNRVMLSFADEAQKDGGFIQHHIYQDIENATGNFEDGAFHKFMTDKVFLPDVKQLKEFVHDRGYNIGAKPSQAARDYSVLSEYGGMPFRTDTNYYYWLESATPNHESKMRVVYPDGAISKDIVAFSANIGVRPALYLSKNKVRPAEVTGNGSLEAPYDIDRTRANVFDQQPPTNVTNFRPGEVTETSIQLIWDRAHDDFDVTGYRLTQDKKVIADNLTQTERNITGLKAGTRYTFTIVAKDAIGNVSPKATPLTVTTLPAVKTTTDTIAPPRPGGLKVTKRTLSGISIAWSAVKDTGGSGIAGYDVMDGNKTRVATTTATKFDFFNLKPLTPKVITIVARDRAGNLSQASSELTIQIDADKIPPSVPSGLRVEKVTATGLTVAWDESSDNVAIGGYKIFNNGAQVGTTDGETTSYALNNLQAGSNNKLEVKAYDTATTPNESASAVLDGVKTYNDTEAPSKPSTLDAVNVGATSFLLRWNASTDNQVVAGYEVFSDGVSIGITNRNELLVTNLTPDTSKQYTVKAFDAAGPTPNESTVSDALSVTTSIDMERPVEPSTLTATNVKSTEFDLRWSGASDDVAVDHYEITAHGEMIMDNVTTTNYKVTGLLPTRNYAIQVRAVDATGKKSILSPPLSVLTNNVDTGPEVDIVTAEPRVRLGAAYPPVSFSVEEDSFVRGRLFFNGLSNLPNFFAENVKMGEHVIHAKMDAQGFYTLNLIAQNTQTPGRGLTYRSIVVDRTKPTIGNFNATSVKTNSNAAISYTNNESGFLTLRIIDPRTNSVVRSIKENELTPAGTNSAVWNGRDATNTNLPDGPYRLSASITDLSGNVSMTASTTILIDRAAPQITGLALSNSTYRLSSKLPPPAVRFTVSEPGAVTVGTYAGETLLAQSAPLNVFAAGMITVPMPGFSVTAVRDLTVRVQLKDAANNLSDVATTVAQILANPPIEGFVIESEFKQSPTKIRPRISFTLAADVASSTITVKRGGVKIHETTGGPMLKGIKSFPLPFELDAMQATEYTIEYFVSYQAGATSSTVTRVVRILKDEPVVSFAVTPGEFASLEFAQATFGMYGPATEKLNYELKVSKAAIVTVRWWQGRSKTFTQGSSVSGRHIISISNPKGGSLKGAIPSLTWGLDPINIEVFVQDNVNNVVRIQRVVAHRPF